MADRCKHDNTALREALDAPDGFPASRHREYIGRLRSVHPHTVVYQETRDQSTCVLYALELAHDPTYRAVATDFNGRIFAGRAFMEWLVRGHLTEIDRPTEGSLMMYFSKGIWQHVGVSSRDGRVISQWGTFPIYEHELCELPARYGDEVRYFLAPRTDELLRLFLEFAKTQGVSDRDIARAMAASEAGRS